MSHKLLSRLDKLYELNANPTWVNQDVYKLLYNPAMLKIAYESIKSSAGNMTKGVDGTTLDGFSISTIENLSEALSNESFQFKPSRRHWIPKSNGKLRPLGIPSPRDKVVQEAIRIILEAIWDSRFEDEKGNKSPTFSKNSHGFRHAFSTHTAITSIKKNWGAPNWVIEGDIKSFFDEIDHEVLINLLRKRIKDERFINLIYKAIKAGYVEDDKLVKSELGTPQGSVISPILANIYLHEFDVWMGEVCQLYTKGKKRKPNPEYRKVVRRIGRIRSPEIEAGEKYEGELKELTKKLRTLPSVDIKDDDYIRVFYTRYADDWVIGVTGPKSLAEKIKDDAFTFLKEQLNLRLSLEKTKITNLRKEKVSFVGFDFFIRASSESKVTDFKKVKHATKRRANHGSNIVVHAPVKKLVNRLKEKGYCDGNLFPTHHKALISLEKDQVVKQYNSILIGLANYYCAVDNFHKLSWVEYILRFSCAKTLANKERTSMKFQFRKRSRNLRVTKTVGDETHTVSFKNFRDVKSQVFHVGSSVSSLDKIFQYDRLHSKSKLGLDKCAVEGCDTGLPVEMHHVKHIKKMGQKTKGFTKLMARINRKQVPLCVACHDRVHNGTYDGLSLSNLDVKYITS